MVRKSPKRIKTAADKSAWFLKKYGLTPTDFEQMRQSQGGKCAICGVIPKGRLAVDHCHATGEVRQLLCSTCNSGLGMFKDNKEFLKSAISYLERHWSAYHEKVERADSALESELY